MAAASLLLTIGAGAAAAETLVAAGDIASPPGGGRADLATARVVEENRPTAVLVLGDTQYEHGEYTNFLRAYDHSWGRFKDLTRPAVGNHEYLDPAGPAAGYFRYFGRQAGNPAKGYYSFDIGPWHAIALNSNCGAAGAPSCAHGSAQWAWLKHDLASHHQRCTLAFFHHPYRSSTGAHTGKAELKHLWAQLVVGGVDLVLNGHNHTYERLKPMHTMATSTTTRPGRSSPAPAAAPWSRHLGPPQLRRPGGRLRRLQDGPVPRPLGRRPQRHRRHHPLPPVDRLPLTAAAGGPGPCHPPALLGGTARLMMVLSVARSCARRKLSGKPALQVALRYWSGGRFAFFRWWAIGAALLARTLLGCRLRGGQE